MPEGKPLFADDCIAQLDRWGISREEVQDDFWAGLDVEGPDGGFRYGNLCVYRYRRQFVMRQVELVVTKVWGRDHMLSGGA